MSQSKDPFWDYVELIMTDGRMKCTFCGRMFPCDTSISRIKWHLSGVKGHGVASCKRVTADVQTAARLASEDPTKRRKTEPSSSNNKGDRVVIPWDPMYQDPMDWQQLDSQAQSNEAAEPSPPASIQRLSPTRMLMEGLGTQQEMGEETNFLSAEAGLQIENRAENTPQPIQSAITPGRTQADVHETGAAAIHAEDIVGPATESFWTEMLAFSNSDALQPLSSKLMSLEFASSEEEVDSELKKWGSRLLLIRAVLDDAEEKQMTNKAVKIWLSKLKDLAYDVEDILDELEIESLHSKLKSAESQASTSTEGKHFQTSTNDLQPRFVAHNKEADSNLKKITARLDDLVKEKNMLDLSTTAVGMSNRVYKKVPTTSLVPKVYGREDDKEAILTLLRHDEPSESPYSVVAITGMGGVGKTTLVQLIYNHNELEFDCRAWVCVSEDFDIVKITKTILQNFGSCVGDDLNLLQVELMKKLSNKKFLIILDDVWSEDYDLWTALASPFAAAAQGSKIIVTTRSTDVSSTISSIPTYMLNVLSEEACFRLFTRHALNAENFNAYPDLKDVGEKIVKRSKGLPLASKTLGGLLHGKRSFEEWEAILNSKIWDLPENKSNILPALRLSYKYLPSHLKRCFAYCAIFPKDYEFDENELVLLWMAEGFLHKPSELKRPEDLGHEYFNDLLSRSFFQQCSDNTSRYIMHDLITDLAQSVSGEVCFQLDDKQPHSAKLCAKIRHSSFTPHKYDTSQRFEVFCDMQGLRTFLALPISPLSYKRCLSTKVVDDFVPPLKCLRVLSLAGYRSLVELSSSISALKHLRYLDLSWTAIEKLPKSLSEVLNLQTLKLCGCEKLVKLPAWIDKLINLRHLDINHTTSLLQMPLEISKLKNLHFLPRFIVGEGRGLGIGELRWLPHLQGQLEITGLDKVTNVYDAMQANLKERQRCVKLALEWSDNFHGARNESNEKQVLDSLQPNKSLEELSITSYGGTEFPDWIGNPSFTKLVDLRLCNCYRSISLPSLGKLTSLKDLRIVGMNKLKRMAAEVFPSLEKLYISEMLEWEQWSNGPSDESIGKFPKLGELELRNCPELTGNLPHCLTSLQKLLIFGCPKLTGLPERLPSLDELIVEDCNRVIFRNVPSFNSLTRLEISGISGLESVNEALLLALVGLVDLVIRNCNQLKYLWQDGVDLDKLANLELLQISNCEELVSLVEGEEGYLPRNLQYLYVIT